MNACAESAIASILSRVLHCCLGSLRGACFACALAAGPATFAPSALAQADATSLALGSPAALGPSPADTFIEQVEVSCGDAPLARQFASALHVELASAGFRAPDPGTRVLLCNLDTGTLSLSFSGRELLLDVSDIPRAARARTLAVALAETLRLPPSELSLPPALETSSGESLTAAAAAGENSSPPRQPASGADRSPAAVRSAPAKAAPLKLTAQWQVPMALRGAVMGSRRTLAFGASLGVSALLAARVRAGVHVGYLTAGTRSVLGAAQLHAVNLEGSFDVTVAPLSANMTLDVGIGAGIYHALVSVASAWGVDEPDVTAWFALADLHAGLATTVSEDLRLLTQVRGVKDLVGLRLRAGGQEAMSFYGFGAELRLGAAYAW